MNDATIIILFVCVVVLLFINGTGIRIYINNIPCQTHTLQLSIESHTAFYTPFGDI